MTYQLDVEQKIGLGLMVCLELFLLLAIAQSSIPGNLALEKVMLLGGLQAVLFVVGTHFLMVLGVIAIISRRFVVSALTLLLLLATNLVLTPLISRSSNFVTLPPNLDRQIQIVGDVMPGFTGISTITTDGKGFRTTKNIDYESTDSHRIFAIGGSTTEQIHLSDEKTWTALLEESLQHSSNESIEVVNTGVAGLRAIHHHATLVEILKYSPDVVLFMMGLNDWNKHISAHFSPKLVNSSAIPNFAADQSVLWRGMELGVSLVVNRSARENAVGIEEFDGSYYAVQNNSLTRPDVRQFPDTDVSDDYRRWVGEILVTCRAHKILCVFVDQPTAYQFSIDPELKVRLWMTPPNQSYTLTLAGMTSVADTYNRWLLETADESGVARCSIAPMVPPTTNYFYDDCHFNEGGARLVAKLIGRCLSELGTYEIQDLAAPLGSSTAMD